MVQNETFNSEPLQPFGEYDYFPSEITLQSEWQTFSIQIEDQDDLGILRNSVPPPIEENPIGGGWDIILAAACLYTLCIIRKKRRALKKQLD